MTSLPEAILALLTYRPEPADVLINELRQWTEGKVYKGPPWQPGDVLAVLDKLTLVGKATLVPGEGYRIPKPKADQQGGLFQ